MYSLYAGRFCCSKMRPIILALCGCRRSGKDTIAKHLLDVSLRDNIPWTHMKISAPLKRCVSSLFDLNHDEIEGDLKDVPLSSGPCAGVTPRRLMQWFGTEVMQHSFSRDIAPRVGRTFWIDMIVKDIRKELISGNNVVISDVRFMHEIETLNRVFPDSLCCLYVHRVSSSESSCCKDDAHESEANVYNLRSHAHFIVNNYDNEIPKFLKDVDKAVRTYIESLNN